jgi:ubiquinone/menaquinone biosynthesis C-methylase UbiE
MDHQQITDAVRSRYREIARQVTDGDHASCCGETTSCCGETRASAASGNTISEHLYTMDDLDGLPLKAALASLGCGNPIALADLRPGETVLDLGSGGGIDVLLSARRVGPEGLAYGLDMTDEMLELARHNTAEAGVTNVRWLKGDIASIPLPNAAIDTIISNCVINLAADKQPVFAEAFRVLKPGGRFAVSDVVIHGGLPAGLEDSAAFRRDLSSWSGCIAGALTDTEYRAGLAAAGFTEIDLEITQRYTLTDVGEVLPAWAQALDPATVEEIVSRFASTFVRARKPAGIG